MIEYKVVRSRRRTLVISVSAGSVVVKAPVGFSDELIRAFVEKKRDWICKKLEQFSDPRFDDVREGKVLLLDGEPHCLRFGSVRCRETGGVFFMKNAAAMREYFKRTRGPLLEREFGMLSARIGIPFSSVAVRDYKARWGSCDASGNISLNWRLCMVPPALRQYVYIHELCHRMHFDHSPAFWRAVGAFCPDYRTARRRLKEYSFLMLLYRSGGENRG